MREDDGRGGGLEMLRAALGRRRWLVLGVAAACFTAAAGVIVSLPDLYRTTATVLVERQPVPETVVRASVAGELETRLQMISQEILSRSRLRELIDRFDLYPNLRGRVAPEVVIEQMRRDIGLELKGADPSGGRGATIAFALGYQGRNPRTVAQVTNALASLYVEENSKVRGQQAADATQFLEMQLEQAKQRLDEQEKRMSEFKTRYMGELPEQVQANLATLERLNAQLGLNSERQLRLLAQREPLGQQLEGGASADPGAPPESAATRLARLTRELADLRARYSDRYPDVARLREEIAALERQSPEPERAGTAQAPVPRLQAVVADMDAQLKALRREESHLRETIALYQGRVESAPRREQGLQRLTRDYETSREAYTSLLKRYEEAQLTQNMEQGHRGETFRVLDPALEPTWPVAPERIQLLVIGLFMSLGAAVAAAFLAERLDSSFHTVDELRAFTRVPVLASIPRIVTASDTARRRRRLWLASAGSLLGLSLIAASSHSIAQGNESLVRLLTRGHY